jgi:flagellar assembly protein FliH
MNSETMKTIIRSPKIGQAKKIFQSNYLDENILASSDDVSISFSVNKEIIEEETAISKESLEILEIKQENEQLKADLDKLRDEYQGFLDDLETHKKIVEEEAYNQGYENSKKAIEKELKPIKQEWEKIVASLKNNLENVLYEQEEECVEVVYTAACRIVGKSAGTKDQIVSVVKEVMKDIANTGNQVVYVSSHDYKNLENHTDFISAHVVSSDEIECGGCIVKAGAGSLDARLEQQFQKLKETLLQVYVSNNTEV